MKTLHTGKIINKVFTPYNLDFYDFTLQEFEGREVTQSIENSDPERSVDYNAYLWGVIYHLISKATGHEPIDLHNKFKKMFGYKSTRTTGPKFHHFVKLVVVYAGEFFKIVFPEPDKNYKVIA